MKKKLNTGVVGLGFGARHLKFLKKNKFSNLIDFFDFNKKTLKTFKKKYNIKVSNTFNKFINNKKLNLIVIASYDNFHYSMIRKAIQKNLHIFVEKPLCQTSEQLRKIIKQLNTKKKRKLKFSTNMVLRAHPKFKKIFQIVNSGLIGKIYHIEGEYNYGRFHKLTNGWRGEIPFYSVTLGGGIHILDLIHWIAKSKFYEAIAVPNNLNSRKTIFKFSDTTTSILRLKNGITAKVTSNFSINSPHHHVLNIHGNKGSIFLSREHCYLYKSNKKGTKKRVLKIQQNKKYKEEILNNFISNICGRKKVHYSNDTIFHVMNTALSIEKSIKSKKWEKIKF